MDIIFTLLKAFAVGGAICTVGQLLIDLTRLTPAKILVSFVIIGVILGGIIYYIVYQTVIFMGLDTDLLKMLSALVVAVFLAIPHLKKTYFTKPVKRSKEAH
jgi:ABC-type uncharacterized transport system permease subunit